MEKSTVETEPILTKYQIYTNHSDVLWNVPLHRCASAERVDTGWTGYCYSSLHVFRSVRRHISIP
jgi:hypothetical protein